MPKWQQLKKQLQTQKEGTQPQSMKRMMRRMTKQGNLNMNEIENVEKVIIYTYDKKIIINEPENVTKMLLPQGEVFQIVGQGLEEDLETEEKETVIKEDIEETSQAEEITGFIPPIGDIQLVSQQAGVTPEEAESALRETKGNLAKAIMMLRQR